MGALTSYSLATSLFLLCGWAVYRIFMAKSTSFAFNRAAISGIYLLSFAAFPLSGLISSMISGLNSGGTGAGNLTVEIQLAGITVPSTPVWPKIIILVYITGVILMSIATFIAAIRIWKLINSGTHYNMEDGNILVIISGQKIAPFSWSRYVVMNVDDYTGPQDMIILHEQTHIACRHWIDLIFARTACIFQWFNPAAWLLLKELRIVHEYQADQGVLTSGTDPVVYQRLLLCRTLRARHTTFSNTFDSSNLKKRIIMMNNAKSSGRSHLRAIALVPALAVAFGLTHIPAVASVLGKTSAAELSTAAPLQVKAENPAPAESHAAGVDKDNLSEPEVKPQFPGGESAMFQWLASNIKYPKAMVDANIEGREIVSFAVETDGTISDVKIIRSVCPEADAEVLRLIPLMPAWKPGTTNGKPVTCHYVLPVSFKLSGLKSDKGNQIRIVSYGEKETDTSAGGNVSSQKYVVPVIEDGKPFNGDLQTIKPEEIDSIKIRKDIPEYPDGCIMIFLKK